MVRVFFALWVLALWRGPGVWALTVADLDPEREWRVEDIEILGNRAFSEKELLGELLTQERPWYLPWRERPVFDPVAFTTDLERLRRFYEARGYYHARVAYDLAVEGPTSRVKVQIRVEEGPPVRVAEVSLDLPSAVQNLQSASLRERLPLKPGEVFTEAAYQQGEQVLREFFLAQGHARAQAQRQAKVDLTQNLAYIRYRVEPGPRAKFGPTRVEGVEKVDPDLVLRELTYREGEKFSLEKIATSRQRILNLGLFSSVQILPEPQGSAVVPIRVRVQERPPRDLKLGVGYGTEDELRAQVEWQHRNWLGGARRLSLSLKYSSISRSLGATLVQPHFLMPTARAVLDFQQGQEEEETFLLNFSRLRPRWTYHLSPTLSGYVGYRFEFAKLNNVAPATIRALGGLEREGILSGPSLGLVWNTTEDPFDPKTGGVVSLWADQIGGIWGGDFRFYKLTAEAKKYQLLGWKTVLATRLKIGIADSLGSELRLPLFERFYAGGEKSVRGYGRRRLGPISRADDPLGGLSLLEGSVELRRPLWRELGGALFLDFGQISTRSLDLPVDDLKFALGLGLSYTTPLGPLRLDVGFPLDPPKGDQAWQVHFSVGQFF